jgi:hypothetical protein
MNRAAKQAVSACNMILQIRKGLCEKLVSLMGCEFSESEDDDETVVSWLEAGVFIRNAGKLDIPPLREPIKPGARGALLRYAPDETPVRRGLHDTGGIR